MSSMSGAKEFSFSRVAYGFVEGVGINASYNVQGYGLLQNGKLHVFASGLCAAQERRHWVGTVTVYDAQGKQIGKGNFGPLKGASLTNGDRETIGEVDVAFTGKPASFGVSAYYTMSCAGGGSAPMAAATKEENVKL